MSQPKEFYCKYQGFEFKSGVDGGDGRTIDWQVITDNLQGIRFCTDGSHFQLCYGTSYELCGQDVGKDEPAKIIRAKNGDIHIDAMAGDIVLKGMNIRIQASDPSGECTITAGKQIATKSAVTSVSATKVNINGTQDVGMTGSTVNSHGKLQNTQSQATDEKQASFLGQIMQAIKKFKQLLECAAG